MPFVRIMTGVRYSEMQKTQISDILHQTQESWGLS